MNSRPRSVKLCGIELDVKRFHTLLKELMDDAEFEENRYDAEERLPHIA